MAQQLDKSDNEIEIHEIAHPAVTESGEVGSTNTQHLKESQRLLRVILQIQLKVNSLIMKLNLVLFNLTHFLAGIIQAEDSEKNGQNHVCGSNIASH